MTMNNPRYIGEHDAQTGKETVREMTDEELALIPNEDAIPASRLE